MNYRTLRDCVADLERTGQLVRIENEIDPDLEAGEIQRRVYQAQGPAIFFANVKGCQFPMVSNLFGTIGRARFLFRHTLDRVRRLVEIKADPAVLLSRPWQYVSPGRAALSMLPRTVRSGGVTAHETRLSALPQLRSWPEDGGAFITLPLVYSEDLDRPGPSGSNLGMYRVQISGGEYVPDREAGLHYQIHRGIGVHHAVALRRGEPFRVNIHVGGPPALILAAVMPLPEGLSELTFAGALGGRRARIIRNRGGLPILADTDFCITGTIDPTRQLPEGPFGDHLGYYSLAHDFPVLSIERVTHRNGAIWPFTIVGRPPQEDTTFGQLIHEITAPMIPAVLPGVRAVHAVDAAGVHPLLLAIGSERYVPYAPLQRPQEILTQANAILGQGQMSLTKYLVIVASGDDPNLDVEDIDRFFTHFLERVDWTRDLHFQTRTTMDTLDYSGGEYNAGSKVVMAAAGPVRRSLPVQIETELHLPPGFSDPRVAGAGLLVVAGPPYSGDRADEQRVIEGFCGAMDRHAPINRFPLVAIVDDAEFTARTQTNWLWTLFTRSNPASDTYGIESFAAEKHWGCAGSLVIDARSKSHHAPPLIEDPDVARRVDALGARGGPLAGII